MKRIASLTAFTLISAALITLSCRKEEKCSIHPEPFRFSVVDGESRSDLLATGIYNPDNIGIYYFSNDERNDLIVNREPEPDGDLTELVSIQLPMISLTGLSDIFYLVLNPEETDTLTVVMGMEIRKGCNYHPYISVKHNGISLPITEGQAFILEK